MYIQYKQDIDFVTNFTLKKVTYLLKNLFKNRFPTTINCRLKLHTYTIHNVAVKMRLNRIGTQSPKAHAFLSPTYANELLRDKHSC